MAYHKINLLYHGCLFVVSAIACPNARDFQDLFETVMDKVNEVYAPEVYGTFL